MKTLLAYLIVLPFLIALAVVLALFEGCQRRTRHKQCAGYYHEENTND